MLTYFSLQSKLHLDLIVVYPKLWINSMLIFLINFREKINIKLAIFKSMAKKKRIE